MSQEKFEIITEDSVQIPKGEHTGKIVGIDTREYQPTQGLPYTYLDITIGFDAGEGLPKGQTVKWGAPYRVTPQTKLGRVLLKFVDWKPGDTLDIADVLINQKVSFMTVDEPGKSGAVFAKVVTESIEPLK